MSYTGTTSTRNKSKIKHSCAVVCWIGPRGAMSGNGNMSSETCRTKGLLFGEQRSRPTVTMVGKVCLSEDMLYVCPMCVIMVGGNCWIADL